MRKSIFIICAIGILFFVSCSNQDNSQDIVKSEAKEAPDSMMYGLACDGTNDSVVVLLLFSGEDPKTYNIENAKAHGNVLGQLQIGDWIGVMINPEDSTEATMVVDLDELKATWTYSVRPRWKDASKMSRRALRNKMEDMPDSLRQAYMVPREYGFTLKRSGVAQAVGYVRRMSSLEDDSPVEYPPVNNYTGWKCRNGHLILTTSSIIPANSKEKPVETYDTLEFVMMTPDSLILKNRSGEAIHFHRKDNAIAANADAQKAVQTTSSTKDVVKNK